jgi:hypothetical protein
MSIKKRALGSLVIVGALFAFVTGGTFALFNASTASGGNLFSTGTLTLSNSNGASATATLANMVPGDSITGLVSVQNTGSEDLTQYAMAAAVTGGAPNVLTTDATNGLQVWVARCSQAWTGTGVTATCGGSQTDVVATLAAPRALTTGSPYTMAGGALCTTNAAVTAAIRTARGTTCAMTGSDYLKVRVSLPSAADNTFQGLSTTVSFTWQGQQATGTNF